MAKKKKAKKVSTPVVCYKASDATKFKIGSEVLVYGGGMYESEFEKVCIGLLLMTATRIFSSLNN